MSLEEHKELFIQERLSEYYKKRKSKNEPDYLERFGTILQKCSPSLTETYDEHLDRYAEQIGQEKEELFVFGIGEGFRMAQAIANIMKE